MWKHIGYFAALEPDIPLTHLSERGSPLNHNKTQAEYLICYLEMAYYGGTTNHESDPGAIMAGPTFNQMININTEIL